MSSQFKKAIWITLLACVFCASLAAFVSCAAKIDYSVTVLIPDDKPAANVTVSLVKEGKTVAQGKTDGNGTAIIAAPADKYTLALADLPEGLGFYEEIVTNTLGTPLQVTLEGKKATYVATVKLPNGSAAANATVSWKGSDNKVQTAKTNQSGVATITLPVGSYVVTVSEPPAGYFLETPVTVTETSPTVELILSDDTRASYSVKVVTEGGLRYPNLTVLAYSGRDVVAEAVTDANGQATIKVDEGTYSLDVDAPYGYYTTENYEISNPQTAVTITLYSKVIDFEADQDTYYTIGSIMHDFTIETFDEKKINLSNLLASVEEGGQGKLAVVLNFWYIGCSWCGKEFPVMADVYEDYSDKLELIAIDPFPEDFVNAYPNEPEKNRELENAYIHNYRIQTGIADATFPMAMDNGYAGTPGSIGGKFPSLTAFPTTVVIDRYGAVAFIHSGAEIEAQSWIDLFETYVADDYVQNFVPGEIQTPDKVVEREKPTIQMPASSELEQAINNVQSGFTFSYYAETDPDYGEYSWPWVASTYDDKTVIVPSNSGHNYSFAIVHTTVSLRKNQVVAFDFFSSTQGGSDVLLVSANDIVQFQISGISATWETCFAYVAEDDGDYDIALLYNKDLNYKDGDDKVYVTNMRICSLDDVNVATDIMRDCVSDWNGTDGYNKHVTAVLGDDGFYHVGTKDGPYVLMDLLYNTHWNELSLANYVYSSNPIYYWFDVDGDGKAEDCFEQLDKLMLVASLSDYYGMVSVNQSIYNLITSFMQYLSQTLEHRDLHQDEWLEICKYSTRYGSDDPIVNPIMGLSDDVTLVAHEGTNTLTLTKPIYPSAGLIYTFTPERDGVFRIWSEGLYETQLFLYDQDGIEDGLLKYCGSDILGRTEEDDVDNFVVHYTMKKDVTYWMKVGFYWAGSTGEYDFHIDYLGTHANVLETCTPGYHTAIVDDDDNFVGNFLQSVEVKLENGKYYAKCDDGSWSVVLVDFTGFTHEHPFCSIETMLRLYYDIPNKIGVFDFTVQPLRDEEHNEVYDENGNLVLVPDPNGRDYTARMRELLATANADGYVEATEELKEILNCYGKRYSFDLDNEWLAFCSFVNSYSVPQA